MTSSQAQAMIATARTSMATGNFPAGGLGMAEAQSPLLTAWNKQSGLGSAWGPTVYASSVGLPRTWEAFRSGQFPPLEPIYPVPIDIGEGVSGRPRPRRFQFMVGWNLPVGQPGTEGIKLANFQVLRDYGEVPSTPRVCIEICKSDIINLDWDIVPTPDAARAMQGNPNKQKDFDLRKAELMEFFQNPDPDNYDGWDEWMNSAAEDILVLDALCMYIQPSTGHGNGPLGSNLGALQLLDGSTVRPLLDEWGGRPRPPVPAYQQVIWGVPRVDLMDLINLGPDATLEDLKDLNPVLEELTTTVDQWDGDQLMYVRMNPRTWTPYGFGPLEQGILPASIILAREQWQFEFFRSGSLPAVFMDPGASIATPEEARQLQSAINMLGGDLAAMHQVIVTPPGAKTTEQKPVDLTSDFDVWINTLMAMSFGLSITDLGITPKMGQLLSPAEAKANHAEATSRTVRRSMIPRVKKLKAKVFDRIIQRICGQTDMEWSWGIVEQGESKNSLVTQNVDLVKGSIATIDEARVALELDPLGLPETTVPLAFLATGVVPLTLSTQLATIQAEKPTTAGAPAVEPKPPQHALPAGDGKQPPTPAHAGSEAVITNPPEPHDEKAVQAELATLRRYLRRHKVADGFTPSAISRAALKVAPVDDVDTYLALVAKAHRRITARERALAPIRQTALATILAHHHKLDTSKPAAFVAGAVAALAAAHHAAYRAGGSGAGEVTPDDDEVFAGWARSKAEAQRQWLQRAAMSIVGGASTFLSRISEYLPATTGSYEQGLAAITAKTTPGALITWHLGDAEHCDECVARDGNVFTESSLPGFPGDGVYGGSLCLGGPRCACWLSYSSPAGVAQTSQPSYARQLGEPGAGIDFPTGNWQDTPPERLAEVAQMPTSVPMDELYSVQERAQIRDAIRSQIAHERGISTWEVPAQDVADRLPPGVSAKPTPDELAAGKAKDFALGSPLSTGLVPFDLETGVRGIYPAPDIKPRPKKKRKRRKAKKAAVPATEAGQQTGILYAGLAVRAANTGRVLLLQRSLEDAGGEAGRWEWPGGHLEDGETPWAGAVREWQEEVGTHLPPGKVVDTWVCPAGTYQCFVYEIPVEESVDLRSSAIENPDGDYFEAAAWFAPADLPGMPSLRTEVAQQTPWSKLRTPATKSAKDRAPHKGPLEHKVHDYLRKHYPEALTAWVCRSAWEKNTVPLDRIAYHNRPGGRDMNKVARMERQIADGKKKKRVVLVDPGSAGKMVVADGYHRLLAMEKLGIKEAKAWVGTPRVGAGNWRRDIHKMQMDVSNASGDEAEGTPGIPSDSAPGERWGEE